MIESALIALAISIDSFALGITYGIRKIRIPKLAVFVITLITVGTLGVSVFMGHIIRQFIPSFAASLLSSITLIGIGTYFMLEGYLQYLSATKYINDFKHVSTGSHVPKIKCFVNMALDVSKADLDVSGDINLKEASCIGFILSIDSLCTGFGYAIGNIRITYFFIFVFIINIISISIGLFLGDKVHLPKTSLKTSLLPGVILIMIGILKWIY